MKTRTFLACLAACVSIILAGTLAFAGPAPKNYGVTGTVSGLSSPPQVGGLTVIVRNSSTGATLGSTVTAADGTYTVLCSTHKTIPITVIVAIPSSCGNQSQASSLAPRSLGAVNFVVPCL